jgi:hypothetical protein
MVEERGNEIDPALIYESAALWSDDAVAPYTIRPPVEKVVGSAAKGDEAEIEYPGYENGRLGNVVLAFRAAGPWCAGSAQSSARWRASERRRAA